MSIVNNIWHFKYICQYLKFHNNNKWQEDFDIIKSKLFKPAIYTLSIIIFDNNLGLKTITYFTYIHQFLLNINFFHINDLHDKYLINEYRINRLINWLLFYYSMFIHSHMHANVIIIPETPNNIAFKLRDHLMVNL